MKHGAYTLEQMIVYGLAVALAMAVAFAPGTARSGAYDTDGPGYKQPRWSNDHHHEQGLIVQEDCVALPPGASADYVPSRDAYGRPVVPAEQPTGFRDNLPVEVELDVNVGTKHIAGKEIEMHAGRFAFDPATSNLTLNGRSWQRDCLPSSK